MSSRRTRVVVLTIVIAAALAGSAYAFRSSVARYALTKGLAAATGTKVSIGALDLHAGHATLRNLSISAHHGEQLAFIPRAEATYNLHDLLPGSRHLYGLRSITVYHPRITVVHNADGTYNLPSLGKKGPARSNATPMNFRMRVVGGSLAVIDRTRLDPQAQRISIGDLNADAVVDTAARTHYTASMAYLQGGARYPIFGHGTIDKALNLNYQRWTAAHIPLPQIVNYALNNAKIRLQAGFLDGLDVRYYGKLSATAALRGGVVAIQGVAAPIKDVHGPLDVTSSGLTTPHIDATIAGAPISVHGAIYDLAHPRFRLLVHAHGQLARLKRLTTAAARLPVRGPIALAVLVEGSVGEPLALILTHSPHIDYRAMPLRNPNGLLAFDGHTATVLNFGVQYGGFTLGARGRMSLVNQPYALDALATLSGPSDQLPYASTLLPPMTLHGTVLATASTLKRVETHGVLEGSGAAGTLASAFAISSRGVGSAVLHAPSLDATVALDHPRNRMSAFVHASDLTVTPSSIAALPGLTVKQLPPVSGTLSGDILASRARGALGLAGTVDLRNARYGKFDIAHAHARFGGTQGNVQVASLRAGGNFGTIDAGGTISGTNHVALEGRYSGSLSQVGAIAGNVPVRGYVDAPIALLYDGKSAVAQIRDAHLRGASLAGIGIGGISATVALTPAGVQVYAAQAQVGKAGSVVASGGLGSGGALAFAASRLPVAGGYADAAGVARGALQSPNARGAVLLQGVHYAGYSIGGASSFRYAGGTASVQHAMIAAGPAVVTAQGTVWPNYDLTASANGLIAYSQFQGALSADVRVRGSGKTPYVAGTVEVPEGSVNGLAFRNMRAHIGGTPTDFTLSGASVLVDETAIAFDAGMAPGSMHASIAAPHAHLEDFDDYFNAGDMLGGNGSLAMHVDLTPFTLASSGRVNLSGVRYRRFEIGRTLAQWNTNARTTSLSAFVGGAHGTARVVGTVVPNSKRLNVNASLQNLDLATWLPLFGYTSPVTGYVDARAAVRGTYPDLAMNGTANLRDGIVGRVHVQRAQITATAWHGRGRITQAIVQIPNLTAQGSGTFGLHKNDALALSVHAASPDIGKLFQTFSGQPNQLAGILDTALRVDGTASNPRGQVALTLSQLRYARFAVPRVTADVSATRTRATLTQARIDLRKGTLAATGTIALKHPQTAPLSLALTADHIDLSDFGAALPSGTTIAGALNGALHIDGSMAAPVLRGSMALSKGYFVGPFDQNPISDMNATVVFSGTRIALQNVRAKVGGGTMRVAATAAVPTLRDLRAVTFDATIAANGAQVNNPHYFRGKFDANVHAYRIAGGLPTIDGSVDIPSARIPLTAFWNPHAPKAPKKAPIDLAFNLRAAIGHDVRVQSPNVDVGAQGAVAITGTLRQPALSGQVVSTGGSVDFLRRFTIARANVSFSPSDGFWPYINAVADTQVGNPLTYVQLQVRGLAPNDMHLTFQSDPSYSRTQILALLSGLQGGGTTGGFTLGGEVQNLAMGELNTLFTRNLFEPLDVGLGQALGLQDLQITDNFASGFGVSAAKAFGKHLTAVFAENLGEPKEQSLSIEAHHGTSTAFDLMFYNVQDPPLMGFLAQANNPFKFNLFSTNQTLTAATGTNGVTLQYEHKF